MIWVNGMLMEAETSADIEPGSSDVVLIIEPRTPVEPSRSELIMPVGVSIPGRGTEIVAPTSTGSTETLAQITRPSPRVEQEPVGLRTEDTTPVMGSVGKETTLVMDSMGRDDTNELGSTKIDVTMPMGSVGTDTTALIDMLSDNVTVGTMAVAVNCETTLPMTESIGSDVEREAESTT